MSMVATIGWPPTDAKHMMEVLIDSNDRTCVSMAPPSSMGATLLGHALELSDSGKCVLQIISVERRIGSQLGQQIPNGVMNYIVDDKR
ncbi:hypothetical protein [Rhodanobacter sp. MP1X3]|uniref:hypothetical protein n=1 Tax=Rhodanobacter sp. MP1X3 TaxID=2723086 RepID=UPI001613A7F8|nr:hypothetical protein [Rhodanobacter sp. MP1X3]MBB6243809.1 hypothetical protein [Rhodanobacter sp. MP1X3]